MPMREPEGQQRLARSESEPAHPRATMALRPICLGTATRVGHVQARARQPVEALSVPATVNPTESRVGGMIPAVEVAMVAAEEW